VTDDNTVTDGTAAFKAVSVSGQITKLSKTEDLIAYVQTSLTASRNYAVGEQFIYNGLLYKATATIAQGGTITIGGNCALADSVTKQINNISITEDITSQFPINTGFLKVYRCNKLIQVSWEINEPIPIGRTTISRNLPMPAIQQGRFGNPPTGLFNDAGSDGLLHTDHYGIVYADGELVVYNSTGSVIGGASKGFCITYLSF
jgi:hypothetical protein